MGLSLQNKTCTLSAEAKLAMMRSADGDGKEGGDAGRFEPGLQYKVKKVKVTEKFFSELTGNPALWRALFDFGPENKIKGPASGKVGKLTIKEKFKNCRSNFTWGISNKIEFTNVRISGIVLYVDGSDMYMDFTHQGCCPVEKLTMQFAAHEGEKRINVRFGGVDEADEAEASKQKDFVDEQKDDGDDSDDDAPPAGARPGPGMPATH